MLNHEKGAFAVQHTRELVHAPAGMAPEAVLAHVGSKPGRDTLEAGFRTLLDMHANGELIELTKLAPVVPNANSGGYEALPLPSTQPGRNLATGMPTYKPLGTGTAFDLSQLRKAVPAAASGTVPAPTARTPLLAARELLSAKPAAGKTASGTVPLSTRA